MDIGILKTLDDTYTSTMSIGDAVEFLNAKTESKNVEKFETSRTILANLGAEAGAAFLDVLESVAASNSAVKWALISIKSSEGININDANTLGMLDLLVAGSAITQATADSVKSLRVQSASIAELAGLPMVKVQHLRRAREL